MTTKKHLTDIMTSIKKGGYDTSEMTLKLDKAILDVQETTYNYQATSVYPQFKEHLKTYASLGKRNKAKVIATLEDVKRELESKKPNDNLMLSKLQLLTDTNFFTNKLQKKMLLDRTLQGKSTTQSEILKVV